MKPENLGRIAPEDLPSIGSMLQENAELERLRDNSEFQSFFRDVQQNGTAVLEKYWQDDEFLARISDTLQS